MLLRARTSIRAKLALLAGVPVVGALLLALFVAHDARQQAASAASLGSIEDLARLTAYIADELHAEQDERAVALGRRRASRARRARGSRAASSDARRATDVGRGPARGLPVDARPDEAPCPSDAGPGRRAGRAPRARRPARALSTANRSRCTSCSPSTARRAARLVSATAALSELSDDGTMLRNISALVALLELEERASIEQAIVGYAAARGRVSAGRVQGAGDDDDRGGRLRSGVPHERLRRRVEVVRGGARARSPGARAARHGPQVHRGHRVPRRCPCGAQPRAAPCGDLRDGRAAAPRPPRARRRRARRPSCARRSA